MSEDRLEPLATPEEKKRGEIVNRLFALLRQPWVLILLAVLLLVALGLSMILLSVYAGPFLPVSAPTPTPTPSFPLTHTLTLSPPPTLPFTPTPIPSATPTLPLTHTPTPTPSPTPTLPPTHTPTPSSTPTPVITAWRGEYYANHGLAGQPVLVRDDPAVDFNWGRGSPARQVPAELFSARWTRDVFFPSGTYQFKVYSDDGVRIWLDRVLIVDQWHDASGVVYTAERELNEGVHSLRVEYYEDQLSARIHFWWERLEDFPQWRGEYFDNTILSGIPTLVRNDGAVNFDWATGSPAASLPVDRFSARWTRTLGFEGGRYRFHAVVDDGARLYLDGSRVIDAWDVGSQREVVAEYTLATGDHEVIVEYFENVGQASIYVWWERLAAYPDWRGEYWSNPDLAGSPALVRNDERIDFNWGDGSPARGLGYDNFSARWTQTVDFDAATYRFHVVVDDGARLWVDDQLLIDSWHEGATRELTADYALVRGQHEVRVTFYEHMRDALIRVWWERISTPTYPDWKGEYWPNRNLAGSPALVRNDPDIQFNWGTGAAAMGLPVDDFSARWSRQVVFEAGTYRFYARADDGVRLFVGDDLFIDEWHLSAGDELYTADRVLAGSYPLRVEYYERGDNALVRVWWERVGPLPTDTPTPTHTPTPTGTPRPTPTPPPTGTPAPTATPREPSVSVPPGIRLNEIMPVVATVDWNVDGLVDEGDEWIEIHNASEAEIDLGGWTLDNGAGGVAYRIPQGTTVGPETHLVFFREDTGIPLDDRGAEVRLRKQVPIEDFVPGPEELPEESAYVEVIVDFVVYGDLPADASYSRAGSGDWYADGSPTPGAANLN